MTNPPAPLECIFEENVHVIDIKLITVFDFKELFGLLQDGDALPPANALASNLSVELTAGGLTPEHTDFVSSYILPLILNGSDSREATSRTHQL